MNFPGVINLSQATSQRVDAFTGAIIRLAAAIEKSNELRVAERGAVSAEIVNAGDLR